MDQIGCGIGDKKNTQSYIVGCKIECLHCNILIMRLVCRESGYYPKLNQT